jgi:hypothetical protein
MAREEVMETKDFLMFLLLRNKEISYDIFSPRYNGSWMKVPKSFAKLVMESTKFVKFECGFDEAGLCRNYRSRRTSGQYTLQNPIGSSKCCCGGCANATGYLQHFAFSDVATYASLFDENDGFWRAGTGCILPRELRSPTCVRHYCLRYDKNDKIVRLSRREEIILYMVDHLGDAFANYLEWRDVYIREARLFHLPGSIDLFIEFIDEWVKRSPDGWLSSEFSTTWREYYEKNPYVSESKAA